MTKNSDNPIDIVISWVNGNDPVHKQKREQYMSKPNSVREDIDAPTRFNSVGEIYYCVASIIKFASFVRQIFIVTDNQNPHLDTFISDNFPENKIPIKIIDHRLIFKNFEEKLPTFNSISIESCLYRIPDLSENFVYFNDDFFLMRPVAASDWFRNNKAVAYGSWRSVAFDNFLRKIKPKKNGRKPFGFKDSMLNAPKILGIKSFYFCIKHTPLPLKKSIFEAYFNQNQDVFSENISYKFRNENQFNPQALFYLLAFKSEDCVKEKKEKSLLIKPAKKEIKYIERKKKTFEHNKKILFGCVESADLAQTEVQKYLFEWVKNLLEIKTI